MADTKTLRVAYGTLTTNLANEVERASGDRTVVSMLNTALERVADEFKDAAMSAEVTAEQFDKAASGAWAAGTAHQKMIARCRFDRALARTFA